MTAPADPATDWSLVQPRDVQVLVDSATVSGAALTSACRTASIYVSAYCTRGWSASEPPAIACEVAARLAVRLASNPTALRSISAEGQGASFAPIGMTFLESLLLAPYRYRSA